MRPKIALLVDWKQQEKKKFWLAEELERHGFIVKLIDIPKYNMKDRIIKWRKIILWLKYFKQALAVCLSKYRYYDYIISWNAVTGAFLALLARLLFVVKPKIILLNLIAHEKAPFYKRLRRVIYRFCFKRADIITTNSYKLNEYYWQEFRIAKEKIFVLTDPVESSSFEYVDITGYEQYDVFSGGEGARDWPTLFKAIELNPELSFIVIARKKYFNVKKMPKNVDIYFDTEEDFFYQKMKASKIVVLPLKSFITAGLIVLGKAMLMGKAVIATRTPVTENYIVSGENGILVEMGNYHQLSDEIKRLIMDEAKIKILGKKARESILESHTEKKYCLRLIEILGSQLK